MTKNKNLWLFAGIWVFLFVINLLFPAQSDDFSHAISAQNGFQSVINSYMNWNGRIGELLFAGFVAGFPPLVFDIVNSIVGTIFIALFFVLIFARLPLRDSDNAIVVLMMFLLMFGTAFTANFAWGSGVLNYMWGLLFIMIFLLPFRFYFGRIFIANFINRGGAARKF